MVNHLPKRAHMLVFMGGRGGGGDGWWWCWVVVEVRGSVLSKTSTQHISKGGGGGSVGKGSPPLDTSAHGKVVVFSTVKYEHTWLVWRGRWWWQRVSPSDTSVHGSCGGGGVLHHCTARWWCSPPSDMSTHSSCGGGGAVGKESNTSTHSSSGGAGGVSKESPPSKMSVCGSFLRVVVVVALAKSLHP